MKITRKNWLHLLTVTAVLGALSQPSNADLVVNFVEDSGNGIVIVNYSGAINSATPDVVAQGNASSGSFVTPNMGSLANFTPGIYNRWNINMTDLKYGPGGGGSSPVDFGLPPFFIINGVLALPTTYVSNSPLSGSLEFVGSFASLGMAEGSYSTTVASSGDKITYNVGGTSMSPIPEITGSSVIVGLLGLSLFGRRRS